MKKKIGMIFGGIFLFSLVIIVGFVMAVSEEASAGATVTINTFVDITLTDTGTAGFAFGSLDPSDINKKEADQVDGASVTPAATITRETTSNVDVKIRLKGDDFTVGTDNLAVTNVDYDNDGLEGEGTDTGPYTQETMQTTYPTGGGFDDPWATLTSADPTVKIWFWLDVPGGQAAGSYTSSFSFEGNSA